MIMNKRKLLTGMFALASVMLGQAAKGSFGYQTIGQRKCKVIFGKANVKGVIDIPQYYEVTCWPGDGWDGYYTPTQYYQVVEIGEGAFKNKADLYELACQVYSVYHEWIAEENDYISDVWTGYHSSVYETIGRNAFRNCSNLSKVSFPNTLKTIGENAFAGCSSLTSISIPSGVTTIDGHAFDGCNSLTTVTVHSETPIELSNDVFSNCGNATLVVPVGCVEAYRSSNGWKNFKEIVEMTYTNIHFDGRTSHTVYNDYGEVSEYYDYGGLDGNIKTFCSENALDFTDVTDVKAYTFDRMENPKLYYNYTQGNYEGSIYMGVRRVYKVAPDQGVILRSDKSGDFKIPNTLYDFSQVDEDTKGRMVGVLVDTTVSPEENGYVNLGLTIDESTYPDNDGYKGDDYYYYNVHHFTYSFHKFSRTGVISGGKAYLQLEKSFYNELVANTGKWRIALRFDDEGDEVLGITTINDNDRKVETGETYYDLQGRRVDHPSKGIYIRNGKKVIINNQ